MRSLIGMMVSALAVFAITILEIAVHVEIIDGWIPDWLVPMINEKFNFALIAVAILIFIAAYFDYRVEKRNYAHSSGERAESKPMDAPPAVRPLPAPSDWTKPPHNVQYVGFNVFNGDDFITATLCFQNVRSGKLLGKFEMPRLRVIYYNHLTGEEIADRCPIVWWNDSGDTPTEIGVDEQYAEIASFFKRIPKWKAYELNEPSEDFDSCHKQNSVEIPAGDIRIIATLSGIYKLRIASVTGVLTLKEDGAASFVRD